MSVDTTLNLPEPLPRDRFTVSPFLALIGCQTTGACSRWLRASQASRGTSSYIWAVPRGNSAARWARGRSAILPAIASHRALTRLTRTAAHLQMLRERELGPCCGSKRRSTIGGSSGWPPNRFRTSSRRTDEDQNAHARATSWWGAAACSTHPVFLESAVSYQLERARKKFSKINLCQCDESGYAARNCALASRCINVFCEFAHYICIGISCASAALPATPVQDSSGCNARKAWARCRSPGVSQFAWLALKCVATLW